MEKTRSGGMELGELVSMARSTYEKAGRLPSFPRHHDPRRTCARETYRNVLEDLRKYFSDDVDSLGSFLGMKFGFGAKSWQQFYDQMCAEVDGNAQWMPGLTLGMALAEIRKSKSRTEPTERDKDNERTSRLNRPRKNKGKSRS